MTLSVFFAALSYDKIRQIQPPVAPSVTTDALDIFVRGLGFGQTTVETFSVSMEHIFFAGIDIIRRAMFRQLLFVYHGRKEPDGREIVRHQIGGVGSHARTVRKASDIMFVRHTKCGVYKSRQFDECPLDIMIMALARLIHNIVKQRAMGRLAFLRFDIHVRHHDNHRSAFSLRDQIFQYLYSPSPFCPRTLVAVDTMNEVKHRKSIGQRVICVRSIDIHASEYSFFFAVPTGMMCHPLLLGLLIEIGLFGASDRYYIPFVHHLPCRVVIERVRFAFPVDAETVGIGLRLNGSRSGMKTSVTQSFHLNSPRAVGVARAILIRIEKIALQIHLSSHAAVAETNGAVFVHRD